MEDLKNETVENAMMFDFEDVFVVRATKPENNDFIITIGNRYATPKHYESQEEAQEAIKNRDWNLSAKYRDWETDSMDWLCLVWLCGCSKTRTRDFRNRLD